jgi:hypothetical protein
MAYDFPINKDAPLAEIQASCLPEIVWTYEATSEAFTRTVLAYRAFRSWNHAQKHGFKLRNVLYHGERLTRRELDALNLWIQSGGAMAASNMDHYAACRLFDQIRLG